MDNERKVALFIDAENVGAEYADKVISVARGYGELIIKRIYGGSKTRPIAEWREKSGEYAILSEIRYVYTAKKNASDISLAVDVMNTLHERNIDVFCIASSDSDFTALAHELRERGKKVIGMGMTTANPTYKSALSEPYIELDNSVKEVNTDKSEKIVETIEKKQSIDKVINIIINTIDALITDKGKALMATLGNRLRNSKEFDFSAFYEKNKDGNLTDFLLKFDEISKRYKKIGTKTDTTLVKKDLQVPQSNSSVPDSLITSSQLVENKTIGVNNKALGIINEKRNNADDNKIQNQPKNNNDFKYKNTDKKAVKINNDKKPSNEKQNSADKLFAPNKPNLANKQNPPDKQSMANKNTDEPTNTNSKIVVETTSVKPKVSKKYRGNRAKKIN